ncbi:hypothetical protein FSP39_002054 [Pinctada imbricata]|uniref:ARID domain-containing protein n=1 Tax=Pinctada imbricata TaxID=66713 RepID=A0AA88YBI7_PINIB|nr:hypothetical protein FSP39_002054 [Pinctada imbricata]
MNPGMHPGQIQGFNPYLRGENYDQHGGMSTMSGGLDFPMQNPPFPGQYTQSVRPGHPGMVKPSGSGPGSFQPQRNMISGQSISQQSGPTPTLNQLLQNPNAPQGRSHGGPGSFVEQQKVDGPPGESSSFGMQPNWSNQRMFSQSQMGVSSPGYRNQGDMASQRTGFSPNSNYMQQGQFSPNTRYSGGGGVHGRQGAVNTPNLSYNNQMGPQYGQQQQQYNSTGYGASSSKSVPPYSSFPPQSQQLNTQMSSGQPPGMTPPPGSTSRPSPSSMSESPHHQRQPSPMHRQPSPSPHRQPSPSPSSRQPLSQSIMSPQQQATPTNQQMPSPAGSNSSWSANNGTKSRSEDGDSANDGGADDVGDPSQATSQGSQPATVSSLRPVPSPAGSSGSRSNTPHSLTASNQAGSPMPPRPPSQHDNQNSRMTQSPMATQGFNQQMMPPPVGPNQIPFGPGGKIPGSMPGSMGHYSQYNSHFPPPQGAYQGRSGPAGMSNPGMQNYPQQNMYNGPSQGHMAGNSHMYNNMPMNRNSNFNMYGGQNMPNQYGSFNGPVGPSQGPGQSGMNASSHPGMDMAGPRLPGSVPGGPNGPAKGAQAAAQAAMMAAASTSSRPQHARHASNTPQKMHGSQGAQVNHSGYGPGMNATNSGVPNSMNQLPNSHSPVPNSAGPNSSLPKSNSVPNEALHSNSSQENFISQSNGPTGSSDSSVSSSTEIQNSKLPSTQNIPPSIQNMQRDSNSSSSSVSNSSVPPSDSNMNNSTAMNMPPQSGAVDSTKDSGTTPTPPSIPNARPESHGADSNLSSLTEDSSQGDVSSSNIPEQKDMPSMPEQASLPPHAKQDLPITTTATTHNSDSNIVTQSITSPVTSITESGNSNDSHPEHYIPHQQNCLPPVTMPTLEEQVPEKTTKKKEGVLPPTPSFVAPSPGGASISSFHEDFDNISSPAGHNWALQVKSGGDVSKLFDMGNEPDRRFFLDRLMNFLEERNTPLHNMPSISKQPLDLYRLYLCVRERGGMVEVTKAKKWKEICGLINIGSSASAAFTLKKNYIKYLFHYECQFDRGGMDPQPILAQMEATLEQKRERKNRRAPSPGSQSSQETFRPPSTHNNNSQGMDGFPPMGGPGYMQNQDPNMGPMPGMMQHGGMMNNMMPNSSMGGMQHNNMMGGMPNMPHPGMMGGNSYMMGGHNQGMMSNNMGMPHNSMMGNNMNMPGNNMSNMGMPHTGGNMGMPPSGNNMGMPPSGGNSMGMSGSGMRGPVNMQGMPGGNMPPGNSMPPQGNTGPPSGSMPPNSMGNVPMNSDSVSCQDPFADEQINAGYQRQQGSNFSGMSPQPSMSSSGGFSRPNMPPSMSKGVSQSGMSQNIPPNNIPSSGGSFGPQNNMSQGMPQNSMVQNLPPNSMAMNTSSSSMGQNMPPSSIPPTTVVQSMPPNSMGQNMPPNSIGHNMPPSSMSQNVPPSSMGQNMPSNNKSQNMPPNNSGQNMPPNSMGQSMPPNSMGQNMPPNSMGQNMPSNSMGQSLPPSTVQNMPPSSLGQNLPSSNAVNLPHMNVGGPLSENDENARATPSASQDSQDLPFSSYQKSEDSNMSNSQSLDTINSSGQFGGTNTTMSTGGRQFPFGDQFTVKPERFDSPNSMQMQSNTPPPQRYPTPQSSQPMSSHPNQPPLDSNMPRFVNQPPQMMSQQGQPHSMENTMNDPCRPPPGFQNPQYQTPNKGMMGHDQYPNYVSGQSQYRGTPMARGDTGAPPSMYSTPNKRYPEPYNSQAGPMSSGYNTPQSGYNFHQAGLSSQPGHSSPSGYYNQTGYSERPNPGQYPYQKDNMSSSYDPQMQEGHMNAQWSPMPQRFPNSHGNPNYMPQNMGGMTPSSSLPPHITPQHRQNINRMSPTRDHKSGYMSPPKPKGMMPGPYPQKKDIPFPPDSVEAISPNYVKRRRLTRADVGQVEAWRLMMALKSGLLAESTWALDTLNILLFDDSSISFFNLTHLPGLLEALLEHFRKCLISIFGETFDEIEKMSDESDDSLCQDYSDLSVDLNVSIKSGAEEDENTEEDFTWVSRKGKQVVVEEDTEGVSPLESKQWDTHSGFSYKYGHWQLGGGDLTSHVVPFFGSKDENAMYKQLFLRPPMELKEEFKNAEKDPDECKKDNCKVVEDQKCDVKTECGNLDNSDVSQNKISDDSNFSEKIDFSNMKDIDLPHIKNNVLKKISVKQEPVDDLEAQINEEKLNASQEEEKPKINLSNHEEENETSNVKVKEEGEVLENEESSVEKVKSEHLAKLEEIQSVVQTKGEVPSLKRKAEAETEDESYQRDDPPLRTVTESNDELGRRCVCISNILRSLSSVPSNHTELSKHPGLMYTLGKLLLLNHRHLPRNTTRKKFDRDDNELEDIVDGHLQQNDEEWWWEYFTQLRENTFVIFANICGHLQLRFYPEEVCLPILDGLLHWAVCPSSCATDPFPSSPASVLSPQRLVLEALCKLCIHEENVDLLLATPPFDRIVHLFGNLVKLLANRNDPVMVEFAIVLLSELVQGDSSAARAIAIQHPSISLLLDFLETAEGKAMQVANHHGINALRDNPEAMGTSLDMLRRTANVLLHLAQVPENRPLFGHHQQRLLSLVMSQILDQYVAQILSDVLYQCFQDKGEEELVS